MTSEGVAREVVEEKLLRFKNLLGLGHWTYTLVTEGLGEDDPVARVMPQYVLEHLVFAFNTKQFGGAEDWASHPDGWESELDRVVFHELIHAVQSGWVETYENKLRELMGPDRAAEFINSIYRLEDQAVDRLARVIRDLNRRVNG